MAPILSVRSLTHKYSAGTPFEKTAVSGVSLEIHKGELLTIIGHTGSGKSTFAQHLNGLIRPTEGDVLLGGESIFSSRRALREARFRVGLVFQYPEYQLFEETVFADIAFGPRNMGLDKAEIGERVRDAARFSDVAEELLQKSPLELSGGQKRRAAIAGVVAMRPEILILDEPTAGLDPMGRDKILRNIREYHAETGGAVILITHDMEQAAAISSRVVVFAEGKIVMDGTPQSVFSRGAELDRMGLGSPGASIMAERLRELGINIPGGIYSIDTLADALADIYFAVKRGFTSC